MALRAAQLGVAVDDRTVRRGRHHALIGGVAGAGIAAGGWDALQVGGVVKKVLIPSVLSVVVGIALAGVLVLGILWLFRHARQHRINRTFRRMQILSAAFVSLTHGTNDAQKTMGVIALALLAAHPGGTFHVPVWVIASAATAMAAGTYSGGWRIIGTLGRRVTHLEPYQGFGAEAATAGILFTTAHFGFPVSTTHTVSGAILGAGAVRKFSAVRWGIVHSIVIAWLLTIPAAGAVAAGMQYLTRVRGGDVVVFVLAVLFAAALFQIRHQQTRSRLPRAVSTAGAALAQEAR
jgi:PiT family inorganic phosphate transporter